MSTMYDAKIPSLVGDELRAEVGRLRALIEEARQHDHWTFNTEVLFHRLCELQRQQLEQVREAIARVGEHAAALRLEYERGAEAEHPLRGLQAWLPQPGEDGEPVQPPNLCFAQEIST